MPTDKFGFWMAMVLVALIASTFATGSTRPARKVLEGVDYSFAAIGTLKDAAIQGQSPPQPAEGGASVEPSSFGQRLQAAREGTVPASFWLPAQGRLGPARYEGCARFIQVDQYGERETWACPPQPQREELR